eukprot:gene18463-20315_t
MLSQADSLADELPLAVNEPPPSFARVNTNDAVLSTQPNSDIQKQFADLRSYLDHIKTPLFDIALSSANRIVFRRRKLWDDAIEKMKLFYNISESNPLPITPMEIEFIGEEGADGGGLRREFFCKVFKKSADKLITGAENNLTFRRDAHKLERKEFENFGKLTPLAFIHGYDGQHNWCQNPIQYVLDPDDVGIYYDVEAIPDGEVKAKMLELSAAQDVESMNKVLDCNLLIDARFEAGFNCIQHIQLKSTEYPCNGTPRYLACDLPSCLIST